MMSLLEIVKDAEKRKVAIGHFNFSTLDQLRAIFEAALSVQAPIIAGVSEGERDFVGARQAAALVRSLREEYNHPIFLNADHTRSLERAREAAEAGYDAIIFDGAQLSLEENIEKTREAVELVKSVNPEIIVEGELGYIGSSSQILKSLPEGAAITEADMTKAEEAAEFVRETKVDMLAPAVGNIHGMFKDAPNPSLNITRVREIKKTAKVPLVLHGGSGITDSDFVSAIEAGISVIHISTEIRFVWRQEVEKFLKDNSDEVAPYKILQPSFLQVKRIVESRLRLFSRL
jgi:fructose-bisphosphate aldolase class II